MAEQHTKIKIVGHVEPPDTKEISKEIGKSADKAVETAARDLYKQLSGDGGGNSSGGSLGAGGIQVTQNNDFGGSTSSVSSSQLSEAAAALASAASRMENSLGRMAEAFGQAAEVSTMFREMNGIISSARAAAERNAEYNKYDSYLGKLSGEAEIERMLSLQLSNNGGLLGWIGKRLAEDRQASKGAGIDLNDKDYKSHNTLITADLRSAMSAREGEGNIVDALRVLLNDTDTYHRKTERDIANRKGMQYDDARNAWKSQQVDNAIKLQQRAAEEAAAAAQAEKARAEEGQKADRARKQNDRIDAVKKDTGSTKPSSQGKGDIDINNKGDININNNRPTSDSGGGAPSGGAPGGKSPGGGGPKRPTDGGAGGPGGPGAPGDNGNTPPKNPDTVRYFNNLNELNKTLRSEYKLDGIADDIQRQLTSLKSSASDIAATFDGNGKLSGISLNAKSIALGDVQTARLTYGVSESQGKYAWNGSAYQTKADDQRLKQGMEKLTRDTSTQQERLNSWLQHDALKLNKSGSNTMREQLLGDIADYVYQNAKGQVKLGHRDMETGRVTRLTSDELKAFTGTMDTFDKRMGAINKGMRQDMVSRGIDDIQGKYDKRIGQVAELKDRLRAVGINPDDKNAVFSSGESVRDLFKSIEKASQQFQGNEGDIAKQVKNYNQIHDLTNRAQLAVKQEERLSKAAVTGANREARIQTRRDAAQQALTAKNADKSPEQVERLNGALAELGKAKTPAQLVTALANVGKYTNELTQSTKEYNKQVTQTETRQEKFAATESKIKSLREQLAAVGIEQPKSLKDANTAANNYRMSKSAEKQQEWADKAAAQLGLAEGPATKLLNEFNKNSGKAENQYQRMLKNSMLGESDREAITKAFDAYTKRKDSSTLQGLQNALASASGNMARTSMENKSAELKERVTSKKADLDAYEKRAGGTNQWTDAERKLFETAGKNLERASELVQKGETSNARSYLSRASTQMSQLNKQLNESERAISQFEQDAGRAETRYNQFKDSGKLNALPQKQQDMINNAFKAFQANRNEQTLKNLTGSLTGGENVTRIQENRNKETDARLSLQKAADKLAGFDERSGNGKKLTDEQKGYRSQAAQFYSEAAKQIDAGQFDNAQKSIQQFNSALSTLTGSFNRSETAAKAAEKAQEAQRKEDERSSAAEAKELVKQGVKTENAQTKAERNAYYGATKESSRDQLTDMAAIFKTTGSADDLKNYQKALTKVQWEEKAAQLKDYNQQLAMMANPNGMPGVDLSKNWASAQIAMRDEILKMQSDFREASKASDQARADSILKQMGSKTSELSRSLADTQKLQDAAKALESTGNYSRVAQGLKDNLTTAMNEMMNTSSQDKFIEKMNAVRTAISNISSEMKQIGLDDYWNQQTAALQNYNNTLQGLTSRNGGQTKWTQGQRDAYAQAQQAYAEAEQAQQARDMGAYQEASKRGNERMNALNQSLTAVGRLSAESKPQVDALSRAMMNFAAPMMLFRKFTGYMKKAAQNVSAIDSQMADLKKVTSNTDAEYQIFLQRAGQHAVQIGSSITDLVATTSTFAHMGYDLNESQALGVTATKFANVGGFKNTTDAADTIIAAIKGFKDLNIGDADEVGDKLTAVANNYAVTATDISEGLRHSASALNVAGNDIDQSTAMITAIAEVTRDAGGAGSALKVLSMRIRGAKAE